VVRPANPKTAVSTPSRLAVVGLAGGVLSGLLGIGGGSVVVPLLVLWLCWEEHRATAASLAALTFAAAFGAFGYGLHGNVDIAKATLIGVPAIAGVVVGTRVAERLAGDVLLMLFVCLQVVVAALILFG
jgi:uncharacterized membrane protein YfcA